MWEGWAKSGDVYYLRMIKIVIINPLMQTDMFDSMELLLKSPRIPVFGACKDNAYKKSFHLWWTHYRKPTWKEYVKHVKTMFTKNTFPFIFDEPISGSLLGTVKKILFNYRLKLVKIVGQWGYKYLKGAPIGIQFHCKVNKVFCAKTVKNVFNFHTLYLKINAILSCCAFKTCM